MTKKEIEDALDCVRCFQDESMCDAYRNYRQLHMCQECVGYQKAIQILTDFVEKMVDKLEENDLR